MREFLESLSKDDLIKLVTISLDELELTESVRFRDGVPYWESNGEDLITVTDEYENAIKEVNKMAIDFKNRLVELVKDDVTEDEIVELNEQFDEILKNIFPSDEMMLDAMKLGAVNGKSIEKQLLEYKVELNNMEQSFKVQVLGK